MEALPHDEVHVWFAEPGGVEAPAEAAAAMALLDEGEVARWRRFAFERDRALFLASHALVRRVLSEYVAIEPRAWRFEAGEHGRPELAVPAAAGLRFNLSHTHGLAACAVVRFADIGVDVERVREDAPIEIADRYFAPGEIAALHARPAEDQARRFFETWTLKESYLKARGTGLGLPLDGFAVSIEEAEPRLRAGAALGDDGEAWQLALHAPTVEHVCALCVRRPAGGGALRVRWRPVPAR